ncbi:MAG TPA: two-component system response regulator CreB [Opitutaceae bacterium]
MASPRILLIEDEPAIADTLLYALRTEGFTPEWRATGGEGLDALARGGVALVILDVGLPDGNGFELCKTIRARHGAVPILFLTARNAEIDRIVGLEIGGDDYVTKPFSPREVTARVKAILRRGPPSTPTCQLLSDKPSEKVPASCHPMDDNASGVQGGGGQGAPRVRAGEFALDPERCEVRFRGVRLELTRYEYRLLSVFLARPGRVFSRDELMGQAWEDPGASLDRTVDAHIKTLRAKLRAVAPDAEPIQTHRGLGYALRG